MSTSCLPLTHCSRRKSFGGFSKILKQLEALFNEIWYRISVFFFPIILRIQSRSRDIRLKCLQGSSLEGGWAVGEAELGSTMPLDKVSGTSLGEFVSLTPSSCQQKEGFWKSYPSLDGCGHFRKILLFCDFTDKAVPGAQHLHLLLSGRTWAAELVCP